MVNNDCSEPLSGKNQNRVDLVTFSIQHRTLELMNFCGIFVQVILVAVLVLLYHDGFEVQADSQASQAVGSWFNSVERRVDIQAMMNGVYGKLKNTANELVENPTRIFQHATGTRTNSIANNEDVDITDLVNSQELADLYDVNSFENRVNEVTSDEAKSEPETELVTDIPNKLKRKKKTKKRKKKHKPKKKHTIIVPEQKAVTSAEVEKAEFGKMHKPHRKIHKRKFVKTAVRDADNNSDSDDTEKGKPVDIIVHIKMNE